MAQVITQIASKHQDVPSDNNFKQWVSACLQKDQQTSEVSIRIVDERESHSLNLQYRGKDNPTNVLSFPIELLDGVECELLGDIVICAPVVEAEALEQNKTSLSHWAHLTIHGTLHLLGYDHEHDIEADIMESREIEILADLGFTNPY